MTTACMNKIYDILIVGSGFSGLGLAITMQKAGYDWHLLEQAETLGGTWRDNHYPGAACDIPSNLYSFSFMPNPDWTRLFPPQAEIAAYMQRCADQGGVRHGMQFNARVVSAQWLEEQSHWLVQLASGEELRARTLAAGTGGLSRPQMPRIKNLDAFQGELFHSARWRHEVDLRGKRVGVIGTGASAIQIVPAIAEQCGSLTLFQRTPAWIIPRQDQAVSEARRALYRAQPWRQALSRKLTYLKLESRMYAFTRAQWLLRRAQKQVEAYLRHRVKDASLRTKLTPNYTIGCKRILLSDDFYPALQKPNVQLLAHGVTEATADGVICADGSVHKLDVLIAATGFQVADAGAPFDITGRDGVNLDQVWAQGPQAHLGTVIHGFPNLFIMTGPNTGLGHNSQIYMIESQINFVLAALRALDKKQARAFDVKAEVQSQYNLAVQGKLVGSVWNSGGCHSWYLAQDGSNRTLWPDFTFLFRHRLKQFDWSEFHVLPQLNKVL